MQIIHVSAECYPAAKSGGLGDVVGALPLYLNKIGVDARVVIPKYRTEWIRNRRFETIMEGTMQLGDGTFQYTIEKEVEQELGFPFYVVSIPGRFDRSGIYLDPDSGYGYWDEFERFLSFQLAVLEWINSEDEDVAPDVVHCHDHHTALIPFLMSNALRYSNLSLTPTVLSIHNAEYHGVQDMDRYHLLPPFNFDNIGLLEWDNRLNSLATGIKTSWRVTTVSPGYMEELKQSAKGLEGLIRQESGKATGIINGIDTEVWNPATDPLIETNYSADNVAEGKHQNKEKLHTNFNLQKDAPLISFIGRLVEEKGADLLPDLFTHFLQKGEHVNFVVLGTGRQNLHRRFQQMQSDHIGFFDTTLSYNEALAHQIYAGSDFMIIPSRVEPCGLNQMYAMRYGTVPIVRSTGGLKDTVVDLNEEDGYGIRFDGFNLDEAVVAIERAVGLYKNQTKFRSLQHNVMELDFSWDRSARQYISLYNELSQN